MMRVGWAAGRVLAQTGGGPVLIGKDTRISGYMFESALEAGLSAAGVDIRLLGPMPTPGIAYLTQSTRAQAGIVISASHNPYQDNGIKFFAADGTKLADDVELAIEAELARPFRIAPAGSLGKARRIADAPRRYIEFCKTRLSPGTDLGGLRIVLDCAHGATYHIAPRVFEELGAAVMATGVEPDGLNINRDCGTMHPEALRQAVLDAQADLGIAFDGDGDRVLMVDHTGVLVDGDELLYIIACSGRERLNGGVVGTLMSNLGLEHALRSLDLEFMRAQVGDRYVMEMLQARNLRLGGESSGHIINLNLARAGDGIISALQVLEAMVLNGRALRDLRMGMHKYPQRLLNVRLQPGTDLDGLPELDAAVREAEQELGNAGRVLVRASGTEPVLRIMVEGEDQTRVDALVHALKARVESVLGAMPPL